MHRHTQHISTRQIPLDLGPIAYMGSESALRTAYGRLELSRHLTLEQAMSYRIYAIGIQNLADAIVRRKQQRSG